MSKIETTSKVSLKLPSRINHGRRGARAERDRRALDPGHSPQPPPPTAQKGPNPPTVHIKTIAPAPARKPRQQNTSRIPSEHTPLYRFKVKFMPHIDNKTPCELGHTTERNDPFC